MTKSLMLLFGVLLLLQTTQNISAQDTTKFSVTILSGFEFGDSGVNEGHLRLFTFMYAVDWNFSKNLRMRFSNKLFKEANPNFAPRGLGISVFNADFYFTPIHDKNWIGALGGGFSFYHITYARAHYAIYTKYKIDPVTGVEYADLKSLEFYYMPTLYNFFGSNIFIEVQRRVSDKIKIVFNTGLEIMGRKGSNFGLDNLSLGLCFNIH